MTNYPRVALGHVPVGDGLGTTHPVVAVDAGNGRANCVTLDKGWTLLREWESLTIEHEFVVYSPEFPQEQKGWESLLRQIAEAKSAAESWEDQALDYKAHLELAEQRIRELEAEKQNPQDRLEKMRRNVSMQIWGVEPSDLEDEVYEFVTAAAERLIQKEDEDA